MGLSLSNFFKVALNLWSVNSMPHVSKGFKSLSLQHVWRVAEVT